MIATRDDASSINNANLGPLAAKCPGLVTFPSYWQYLRADTKQRFVKTECLKHLQDWASNSHPIVESQQDALDQARDALVVAKCCLWIQRDNDVNEHPDVMLNLSPAFVTSCNNLVLFTTAFINENCGSWPANMALAMMIERAKDELKATQGW